MIAARVNQLKTRVTRQHYRLLLSRPSPLTSLVSSLATREPHRGLFIILQQILKSGARALNLINAQSTIRSEHFLFFQSSWLQSSRSRRKLRASDFFSTLCFAKMLNQVAVEAIYSATYLENYLDSVENLPNDLQRHISRMRQLDVDFQGTTYHLYNMI